ncbi:MAG: M20/M25/M40 family metallo-hydrolase [Phyllobacteriaceae bacterium]|nr:M20/M25/M40 family metallo-hydrolase [Phyllobacteriaceae bacterium]
MTDIAARISDLVDAAFADEVAMVAALVKCPSDNPPGDCAAHAEVTAKELEARGFAVERHPVPEAVVRANGMISATNLITRSVFGTGGPVIALNAHGDVVPPGEGWTCDPYGAEIRDGWMYGRGVAVSKCDFATYAFAIQALRKAGVPLNGTLEIHGTWDEEAGGEIGPKWLLDEGLSKPTHAVAASFSYAVVDAHNGCLHLEIVVEGKSAHAAIPYTGIDALEAATGVLNGLYAFRKSLAQKVSATPGIGSPQLTVGLIEGGINTNVVPDKVKLRLDRRMIPEENPEAVEAELRGVIEGAMKAYPAARVTVNRILLARPLAPLPGSEKLTEALCRRASEVFGEPIGIKGLPLYTDARHYAEAGVPIVLYGAGPRSITEANAHRADERLPLEDLRKATKVVALALADLMG